MKTNKEQLLKYFATVLRNRALGKETDSLMRKNLTFYFSRKELIEILKKKFGGTIPKEHDLVELENKELLELIGDEMFIISFITEKWSKEVSEKKPKTEKVNPSSSKTQNPKPSNQKKS
ncbi:hypothetical protein [Psychroserpens algicola]|uniref:Uncharacterized protein n=1 Tax=Psychroserpens algicola TaxID=1719034 RepID=A0ABT0H3U2_9FLAO|nr:hypothetical protein [Psychroserpens algicola]MCK8479039.1 hypothetical protein [Psychroserpens algicola]